MKKRTVTYMTKDQTVKSSDIQEAVQQLKKPFIVEMNFRCVNTFLALREARQKKRLRMISAFILGLTEAAPGNMAEKHLCYGGIYCIKKSKECTE